MSDVFTKEKRSEVMSHIRSRGNRRTELALVRLLRANHLVGWRRHPSIFGKPDFIFRKQRVVVFVDGCFWHRCGRCAFKPATNREYWESKLKMNQKRDRIVNRVLTEVGWNVVRVWEHSLKRPDGFVKRLRRVLEA